MDLARKIAWLVVAGLAFLVVEAHGAPAPADTLSGYELGSPPSEFLWGCFPPCVCPEPSQAALTGTFRLLRRGRPDPISMTSTFDVRDLKWVAAVDGKPVTITGEGTYTHTGGDTPVEHLVLDLAFDGEAHKRFDSGAHTAAAAFPEIRLRLSLHGEHCRDSVLVVQAHPLGLVKPAPRARMESPARMEREPGTSRRPPR